MKNNLRAIFRTWLYGVFIGIDSQGNKYYTAKKNSNIEGKRWVMFSRECDASNISSAWQHWLTHSVSLSPAEKSRKAYPWQKPRLPNPTGSNEAYLPTGSIKSEYNLQKTSHYEPWVPNNKESNI